MKLIVNILFFVTLFQVVFSYGEKCTYNGVAGTCMNPTKCTGTIYNNLCPGGSDNKCCIPPSDKCKSAGGTCMNPKNCSGTVKDNLCPGGSDNKCCVPSNDKCKSAGGTCMNPKNCNGTIKDNLCPGGSNNKCCVQGNDKIRTIYNYFVKNVPGTTKEGVAGILGCWDIESAIEPKRAEGDYMKPPIGAPSKNDPCWDNVTWLSMTGPQIYNGKYPAILKRGLGLGQWTDTKGSPRNTNLRNYANKKGKKWYDLNLQLDFMIYGDDPYAIKVAKEVLTTKDTVNNLTKLFLNKWEGGNNNKLAERQASAQRIYNIIKNY